MASESRKPYLLTVSPINYSLTDGTNIPAPPDSPPPSPRVGPTASVMPGTFPPSTPEREASIDQQASLSPIDNNAHPGRTDSFATPLSPASLNQSSPANADRRPPGVRRLFSLSSLRQSFSSSRTSLSLAPPESSADAAEPDAAYLAARPASRAQSGVAPSVRGPRSNNWFKRKSGFFTKTDDTGTLDVVREDSRPDSRDHKRLKPLLPEISNLSGGELDDGKLGWDEQIFKQ